MKAVFLDTVGLIAVWERGDQWHVDASRVFQMLLHSRVPLVTTPSVLLECGNASARRPCRGDVTLLRYSLMTTGSLFVPLQVEEDLAWVAYERGEAGQAGIVDRLSFVVMRRLGLTQAFTNDTHFRAARFETLF